MEVLRMILGLPLEREVFRRPTFIFFIVNVHPHEACTLEIATLVKTNLEKSGFGIPIEIVQVPSEHEINGAKLPWYEAVAKKGYGIRDSLQRKTTGDLVKEKGLDEREVARIEFHNSEYLNRLAEPCAFGAWKNIMIETPAVYQDVTDANILALIKNRRARRRLGKDIRRLKRVADIDATREAGLFSDNIINDVAGIVRKVTSDIGVFVTPQAKK